MEIFNRKAHEECKGDQGKKQSQNILRSEELPRAVTAFCPPILLLYPFQLNCV